MCLPIGQLMFSMMLGWQELVVFMTLQEAPMIESMPTETSYEDC